MLTRLTLFIFFLSCFASCGNEGNNKEEDLDVPAIPPINYVLTKTYPHDTASFTEGLVIYNRKLYESTGSPDNMPQTRSLVGELDTTTGQIKKKIELDREQYFGEGIVFLNDKLYQLTYQNKLGFVYDASSFKKLREFSLPVKEGWGMTTDGTLLIISDGTNILTCLEPINFKTVKTITVTDFNGAVNNLNELEYIKGFIYANVYTTNYILKINPNTGNVIGKIDLGGLVYEAKTKYRGSLELNGIAYDSAKQVAYVTGKMWPHLYAISLKF